MNEKEKNRRAESVERRSSKRKKSACVCSHSKVHRTPRPFYVPCTTVSSSTSAVPLLLYSFSSHTQPLSMRIHLHTLHPRRAFGHSPFLFCKLGSSNILFTN